MGLEPAKRIGQMPAQADSLIRRRDRGLIRPAIARRQIVIVLAAEDNATR